MILPVFSYQGAMMRVHLLSIAAFVSLLVLSTQHAASNTQQNAAPSLTTAVTKAIEVHIYYV